MSTGPFRTFEVSDPSLEVEGLRHVTVHSAALGRRADLTLWVPDAPGPLPVVVLLHGIYTSHWAWAYKAGAHRTAARLVASGAIPPMVLAMPSDGLWGDGSGYVSQPDCDAEAWIAEELVEAVKLAVPEVPPLPVTFLAGLSMGGFGALRVGARHADRFEALASHSGFTSLRHLDGLVAQPLENVGDLGDLLVGCDALLPIRFDCGTDDPFLPANRALHERLDVAGVRHTYVEHPGGHDWGYWAQHLPETLTFFADVLADRQGALRPPG